MYNEVLRVFSYGGGVQSTLALVKAAQGEIDFPYFLFCNVGNDSEHPATLDYVRNVAMPYAEKHGIKLIELQKTMRDGSVDTLYSRIKKPGSRSVPIPVRMASNGAPGNRSCTADFKIKVVDKWLKDNGIREILQAEKAFKHWKDGNRSQDVTDSLSNHPGIIRALFEHGKVARPLAQVGLGISLDEIQRVKPNMDPDTMDWKENVFPLLFELKKPMDRASCIEEIKKAGLPVPPKSACWFCPYHRLSKWQDMRQNEEELFWKSVELERYVNEVRREIGKDEVYFSSKLIPLDLATTSYKQASLFEEQEDEMCESGYCMN